MNELLRIELMGLPPTVNQMYRNKSTYVRYKTTATREYQDYVIGEIGKVFILPPQKCSVSVFIKFLVKDNRKWDIDNRLKSLLDCLQGTVIENDNQVDEILIVRKRGYTTTKTLLVVRLI